MFHRASCELRVWLEMLWSVTGWTVLHARLHVWMLSCRRFRFCILQPWGTPAAHERAPESVTMDNLCPFGSFVSALLQLNLATARLCSWFPGLFMSFSAGSGSSVTGSPWLPFLASISRHSACLQARMCLGACVINQACTEALTAWLLQIRTPSHACR